MICQRGAAIMNKISKKTLIHKNQVADGTLEGINKFNAFEVRWVKKIANRSRWSGYFATSISQMFNGWIYPFVATALIFIYGGLSIGIIVPALLSTIVVHSFYPFIKRYFQRVRPIEFDPTIKNGLKVLDRYSFPSGHCMTLTTVSIPIVYANSYMFEPLILTYFVLSWSRISLGHHYPSDIVAGILLGCLVGFPISFVSSSLFN